MRWVRSQTASCWARASTAMAWASSESAGSGRCMSMSVRSTFARTTESPWSDFFPEPNAGPGSGPRPSG